MLQIYADMLDNTSSPGAKLAIQARVMFDMPVSVCKQQISYFGGIMTNEMPYYVKRNALIAGALLVPFTLAIGAEMLDELVNQQNLYGSWAWQIPVITIWVLWLPLAAMVIAGASYAAFLAQRRAKLRQAIFAIHYSWPLLVVLACGLGILALLFGHDSVHCFLGNPVHTL